MSETLEEQRSLEHQNPPWFDESKCQELESLGFILHKESLPENLFMTFLRTDIQLNGECILIQSMEQIGDITLPTPDPRAVSLDDTLKVIKKAVVFRDAFIVEGYDYYKSGSDHGVFGVDMRKAFAGTFRTDVIKEARKIADIISRLEGKPAVL